MLNKPSSASQIESSRAKIPSGSYDSTQDTKDHISRVQALLEECRIILMNRAWVHDRSKLEEPEKTGYDTIAIKLKDIKYGSPEYLQALQELKPTLDHHYRFNSHHPEHWSNGIEDMSLFDIIEMLMDWKAATERMKNGGDIWKSIAFNQGRFALQSQLTRILQNTAREMKWEKKENETQNSTISS